jgi:1-phosphofructokinase/tagatose 6-phosphate kinase
VIVSVAPSPSLDRTLLVEDVTVGAIHRPHDVRAVAGGKGLNVARAAHALGNDVVAIAILGGPTGGVVRSLLDREGVLANIVPGSGNTRTCTSIASTTDQKLTEFYEMATTVTEREWRELEQRVDDECDRRPRWLTISGSMPPGAPTDAVGRLTALAHSRGVRVAVDTHGPALTGALDEHADIIKVNVHEAAAVLGFGPDQLPSPQHAAQLLHDRREHGWLTVVTAGTDGAWAIADGPMFHVAAGAHGAFPVGSGDCFMAGLVSGLKESSDNVAYSLALATAAASANAQLPGAALFEPAIAREAATRVEVREL